MEPNQILSIALASVPTTLTVLIGILINNSRLGDLNARIGDVSSRIGNVNARIGDVSSRIDDLRAHMDSRFDEMRNICQSDLRRFEHVLDARLKRLEER